jgi:hypothetical protein
MVLAKLPYQSQSCSCVPSHNHVSATAFRLFLPQFPPTSFSSCTLSGTISWASVRLCENDLECLIKMINIFGYKIHFLTYDLERLLCARYYLPIRFHYFMLLSRKTMINFITVATEALDIAFHLMNIYLLWILFNFFTNGSQTMHQNKFREL